MDFKRKHGATSDSWNKIEKRRISFLPPVKAVCTHIAGSSEEPAPSIIWKRVSRR